MLSHEESPQALDRKAIMGIIPHQGKSCLLDRLVRWNDTTIVCAARNHLDLSHPLRHSGKLHPICSPEYGMQAAALHGALKSGDAGAAKAGLLISIRGLMWHTLRLDDPDHGELGIEATLEGASSTGHLYAFRLISEQGRCLAEGRGAVALI